MSEVNDVLVVLPELAVVAGYIGGQVVDHIAGRIGDDKRTEAVHTQGVSAEELQGYLDGNSHGRGAITPPVAQPTEEGSRAGQRFDRLTRPVAIAMSVSALLLAMNVHKQPSHRVANPILEVDVDHPWNSIGDGTITPINAMATAFENSGSLQVTAEVAEDAIAHQTTLPNLTSAANTPNDATSLPLAVSQSVDTALASIHTTRRSTHGMNPNAGLLVITDDSPLVVPNSNQNGQPESPVQAALNEASGLPISIVNEGNGTDQNAQDLMAIAKATHGHYYGAKTQPTAVVSAMQHDIQPKAETIPAPKEDTLWIKIVTLMSFGLTAKLIAERAKLQWRGKLRQDKAH